jgi:tetratricopeptide (TPR) repeat protein
MNRIEKINDMLIATPNDCFLLHALGLEYVKISELKYAIEAFRKVLKSDSQYVGTYYHLAKTYEELHQNSDAIETYEMGIEIAKKVNDKHAQNELQMALDDLIY